MSMPVWQGDASNGETGRFQKMLVWQRDLKNAGVAGKF